MIEPEPNCLGITILDNITVELSFDDRRSYSDAIELQIEPKIIMHGQASELSPGVTYNEGFYVYDDARARGFTSIGEIVAYGINDGNATEGFIEADEDLPLVWWRVRSDCLSILAKHGIVS